MKEHPFIITKPTSEPKSMHGSTEKETSTAVLEDTRQYAVSIPDRDSSELEAVESPHHSFKNLLPTLPLATQNRNSLISSFIQESLIDFDAFLSRDIHPSKFYMEPWLKENTINIISAQKGVGKSMLVESIAVALTHGESIGTWKVNEPSSVLLIDGEMAQEDLHSRLKGLSSGMTRKADFKILSADDMASRGLSTPTIASPEWRESIFDIITVLKSDVVILDNVSSLAPGLDENNKKEWDPVNQWLIKLRSNGFTVIIVFHLGKDSTRGVRGHSGMQDSVDTILELRSASGHLPGQSASFSISFEKSRGLMEGASKPVTISYIREETGKISWGSSDSKGNLLNKRERAIVCLAYGKTPKEIADHCICVRQYASNVKKEAQESGILTKDCKFTEHGEAEFADIVFEEVWG